jgi:hypothetical protein
MTFKEALEAKNKDTYLEYHMRAARIVNWVQEQHEISDEIAEELYSELVEAIIDSDDEFDELAIEMLKHLIPWNEDEEE